MNPSSEEEERSPPYTPGESSRRQQLVEIRTEMPSFTRSVEPLEPSSSPPLRSRPDGRLLGNREDYLRIGVPLYEASVKGDWEAARVLLENDSELVRCSITENYETSLHIAVSTKSTKLVEKYVENLVGMMTPEDLQLHNLSGNTALCLAAAGGNVNIARILVTKNRLLVDIFGSQSLMPLQIASSYGKYDMVNYLYQESNGMNGSSPSWTNTNRGSVLLQCVEADFFDIALQIVTDLPELALDGRVLGVLARKTDAFREIKPHFIWMVISRIFAAVHVKIGPLKIESDAMKLLRVMWTIIVKRSKAEVEDIIRGPPDTAQQYYGAPRRKYSSQVLFIAAEMGNTRFIVELIRQYPDLIRKVNDNNQSIFHVAISHRQEGVYNLLHEIGSMKDNITPLCDENGNNMLHLAAKGAKKNRLQDVSGVALQMQRELLWFKEVESLLPPSDREKKNKDGVLPREMFTTEHKDLVTASEKWMKDTASQCMVVTTLIATIVFAAAFTVPGGYNQDNGIPVLRHKRAFIAFVIADAISLTFATISIIMFLYIFTSRYAEQDFLESLPKKLMRGLETLFLSITAMMVSFSVSFFVLYDKELIWVPVFIGVISLIPVILNAKLQRNLLADVYHSTYGSTKMFKPEKPMLYG